MTHGEFTKHVAATPFPSLALQSPVTEVMLAYFPSDISQADKDAATAQFQHFSRQTLEKCSDVTGVSYGWGIENDFPVRGGEEGQVEAVLVALIGWPSIDAHMKFRKTIIFNENEALVMGVQGYISGVMFHVSCRSLGRVIEE